MADKKNKKKEEDAKEKAKALAKKRMEEQPEEEEEEEQEEEEEEQKKPNKGKAEEEEEEEQEEEQEEEEQEEEGEGEEEEENEEQAEEGNDAEEQEGEDEEEQEEEEEEEKVGSKPQKKETKKETETNNPESLASLKKNDPEIKNLSYNIFEKPSSSQSVANAKKSLIAKHHMVTVVKSGDEALKELKNILGDHKSSISLGFSTTLEQIGFHSYLKSKECQDIKNYKADAAAAEAKGDAAKASEYRIAGLGADIFFTGAAAISEDGVIVSGDASSTRIGGMTAAKKKVVVIIGANKIVKDEKAALARLYDYQLPIESARARIAYAKWGIKGSAVNYQSTIKSGSPFFPNRLHVIIIEGQSYGF